MPDVCFRNFFAYYPDLVQAVQYGVIEVDDDNNTIHDNNLTLGQKNNPNEFQYSKNRGHKGIFFRQNARENHYRVKLKNHNSLLKLTKLQLFGILFQ